MQKSWLLGLGLVVGLAVPGPAAAGDDKAAAPAKPALQDLDKAYADLAKEYSAARERYEAEEQDAREKKLPSKEWPKSPDGDFYPRFEALSLQGHVKSLRWCVENADAMPRPSRERQKGLVKELDLKQKEDKEREQKIVAMFETLIDALVRSEDAQPAAGDDFNLTHLLRSARGLSSSNLISRDEALRLCAVIGEKTHKVEMKAGALYTQGVILSAEKDGTQQKKGLEIYAKVIAQFPDSKEAKKAAGQVNRIENLVIGRVAPDFATSDVEGVEFRLSEYRGKVVVLDFWGFW